MSVLSALILAVVWLSAAAAAGVTLIRLVGVRPAARLEWLLLALGLGFPLASYAMFAAGSAGWLRPAAAWTVLVILTAIGLPAWRRSRPGSGPRSSSAEHHAQSGSEWRLVIAVAGIVGLVASFNLIGALAPPTEWDSLDHHLAAPAYFVRQGRISFVPYRNWPDPSTAEMWNLIGLLLGSDRFAQMISWAMGLAGAGALYLLASRRASPLVGIVAAGVYYVAPQVTVLSASAKNDLTWLFFVFLSFHALLRWSEEHDTRWFWISACFTGLAMATKLHGLFWAVSIGMALIMIQGRRWMCEPGRMLTQTVGYALVAGAVVMPWWLRNLLAGGDPIWPYAFPWLHSLFWSQRWHEKYTTWVQGPGDSVAHYVLGLWNVTVNQSAWLLGLRRPLTPVVLAFAPVAAVSWSRLSASLRWFLALTTVAAMVYYSLWFVTYQLPRYLLPSVSLLTIPAAAAFWWMAHRRWLWWTATGFLLSALAFGAAYAAAFNLRMAPVVVGLQSEHQFLARNVSFYEDLMWVDRHLPSNARVLYFGLKTYYLRRDFLRGDPNVWPLDERAPTGDLLHLLRARGVTHIFVTGADREAGELTAMHRGLGELQARGYFRTIYVNPTGVQVESRGLGKSRRVRVEVWEIR